MALEELTGQFSYQVLDKDFVDLDHERGGLQANPGAEDLDEAWNRKTRNLDFMDQVIGETFKSLAQAFKHLIYNLVKAV